MNTDTGRIYRLGEDVAQSAFFTSEMDNHDWSELPAPVPVADRSEFEEMFGRRPTEDEYEAFADRLRGHLIVPVSETVAQTMLVGQRELERRRNRNRAARAARKRNR